MSIATDSGGVGHWFPECDADATLRVSHCGNAYYNPAYERHDRSMSMETDCKRCCLEFLRWAATSVKDLSGVLPKAAGRRELAMVRLLAPVCFREGDNGNQLYEIYRGEPYFPINLDDWFLSSQREGYLTDGKGAYRPVFGFAVGEIVR